MLRRNRNVWRDWCPMCGTRFEAETAEELGQKILDHFTAKMGRRVTVNNIGFLWRRL